MIVLLGSKRHSFTTNQTYRHKSWVKLVYKLLNILFNYKNNN